MNYYEILSKIIILYCTRMLIVQQ